jgi:hypothetical protein
MTEIRYGVIAFLGQPDAFVSVFILVESKARVSRRLFLPIEGPELIFEISAPAPSLHGFGEQK